MVKFSSLVLMLWSCAYVAGCTLVTSKQHGTEAGKDAGEGVAYYLPKRFFEITITSKVVPVTDADKLEKELQSSAAAVTAARALAADAQKESTALEAIAKKSVGTPNADDATKAASAATAKSEALNEAAVKAAANFEAARQNYVSSLQQPDASSCLRRVSVVVKPLALVPDTTRRYSAQLKHSVLRSDELTLTTTSSGLLAGALGKSQDKSADIVLALANSAAARRAQTAELRPFRSTIPTQKTEKSCLDAQESMITDFTTDGSQSASAWSHESGSTGVTLTLDASAPPPPDNVCELRSACVDNGNSVASSPEKGVTLRGLVYRRDLTHRLTARAKQGSGNAGVVIAQALLTMPNLSPTEFLPLRTGAFTDVSYTVAFENGMLTSVAATRPSEALGFAKIPYDLAVAAVKIPAEIFKLRVDLTSQKAELATKEAELIDKIEALDAARTTTVDAEQPEPANP